MTKPKKNIVEAAIPIEVDPPRPQEAGEEFAGVYPTAKVMVWERTRDKPDALIGTYDADGEVQARVAEQVGGGEFVWRIRLVNGQWASFEKHGIIPRGRFSISERTFPKLKAVPALPPPPPPPPAPVEQPMNMQVMMMAMMQQQTSLLTALIGKPGPDPIAMMQAFHSMLPPPAPSANGLESINTAMDLMSKAQDLIPVPRGGGGGSKMEDRIFSLIETVAPTIANRLLTPAPAPRQQPQAQMPAPALAPAPLPEVEPAPVENPPEGDPVDLKKSVQYAMLSPYINKLIDTAEKHRDPESYADIFLDEAEDKGLTPEQIRNFFDGKNLIAELSEKFPGVKKNADWFNLFREAVVAMLQPNREADTMTGDVIPPEPADPATNSDA